MGNCCTGSSNEVESDNNEDVIEEQLEKDQVEDEDRVKLLLLGAGQSGKSTIVKQMISNYSDPWTNQELEDWRYIVNNNLIEGIKRLLDVCEMLIEEGKVKNELSDKVKKLKVEVFDELDELKGEVDEKLGESIKVVWNDAAIKETTSFRTSFHLSDSFEYFMGRLNEIVQPDYLPSNTDILRARVRTTGITEREFTVDNIDYLVVDVGGQRNERKKWMACFDEVTSVIYACAVSEFDQGVYEDNSTNSITESLELFEQTINNNWFVETPIVLFLNKVDLLKDKLKYVDFVDHYPDFKGENTVEDVTEYLTNAFASKNKSKTRKILVYYTIATDPFSFVKTFEAVTNDLIKNLVD